MLHDLRANSFNKCTTKYREIIQVLTVLTSQRYQCVYMALRLYTEIQSPGISPGQACGGNLMVTTLLFVGNRCPLNEKKTNGKLDNSPWLSAFVG